MHVDDGYVAPNGRGFQEREIPVAVGQRSRAGAALADARVTAVFQQPTQPDQVVGVRPGAVFLRVLQRV